MGLLTRFAAVVLATNVGVAFFFAHKGALSVGHSGELAFIYLRGYISLLFAGLRAAEFPLTPGPLPQGRGRLAAAAPHGPNAFAKAKGACQRTAGRKAVEYTALIGCMPPFLGL